MALTQEMFTFAAAAEILRNSSEASQSHLDIAKQELTSFMGGTRLEFSADLYFGVRKAEGVIAKNPDNRGTRKEGLWEFI